ncbi:restriction endonuclease [Corynebacterium canis]|uniref:Restriction endonuclease n=1 Tax=Corynebacterium canis TaxID=679663 RepID=A0A5C5USN1_9CORY|nr:NgoMIV family type II restriction endonuclease [Corynebacterium canis]TWT28799.1 restriction endonuclease [Corynebacterium canis]WJY74926.1 Type-2 restriction enzyme NgoMIV [Corynebacterium canis]
MDAILTRARKEFHADIVDQQLLVIDSNGVASNADSSQRFSRETALDIANRLGAHKVQKKISGQSAGRIFESAVQSFLESSFLALHSIRPGDWKVENFGNSRSEYHLGRYVPYRHLIALANAIEKDPTLTAALGNSYDISPDVLVLRNPVLDDTINKRDLIVDALAGNRSPIRMSNQKSPIVHAVISCKWTLRSDRAQNARSEALNIIRNRKGRTPHIAVVTGEPSPSRIASLALGTGDLDTVYHFALEELLEATIKSDNSEAIQTLHNLVDGERLRDISDLPLDLAV